MCRFKRRYAGAFIHTAFINVAGSHRRTHVGGVEGEVLRIARYANADSNVVHTRALRDFDSPFTRGKRGGEKQRVLRIEISRDFTSHRFALSQNSLTYCDINSILIRNVSSLSAIKTEIPCCVDEIEIFL